MRPFRRRTFGSFRAFLRELGHQLIHLPALRRAFRHPSIPPAFRERLFLAVTAVNGCRYCSWAHARAGLAAGLSHEETALLLRGVVALDRSAEVPALWYAQAWAEAGGRPPDDAALGTLRATYGEDTARHLHTLFRAIRFGNLFGNSVDSLLHRLSRGRLGGNRG
ncbi:MAG: carboxymuconolactone decarboxylase family protein [Deltaproteobacteria bacterium]|nr:carboxymuconolactone decarboxylase family protein [Deltaproteobacteria bacterium]